MGGLAGLRLREGPEAGEGPEVQRGSNQSLAPSGLGAMANSELERLLVPCFRKTSAFKTVPGS